MNYFDLYEEAEPIEKKLKWWQKALIWTIAMIFKSMVLPRLQQRKAIKDKVRYMKPTIHEGILFNSITWEMRDKPLTEQELKDFDI
jgi:hypothetical protein